MNTSTPKIPTETLPNCISQIGSISTDTFSDFMATSRSQLSKATLKTKETVKLKSFSTSKITQSKWTNKKSKTTDFPSEKVSSEEKSVSAKMESSSLLTILSLAIQLPFMEETFTFMIATGIQESFSKNWDNLKDLQNHIKTINGPLKSTTSGFLKKTQSWKSISKRNSEEER